MREKLYRFMQGRYGVDDLSKFLMALLFVVLIISLVFRLPYVGILMWVLLVWTYFRMFSKRLDKRRKENDAYLKLRNGFLGIFGVKPKVASYQYGAYRGSTSYTKQATPKDKTHRIFLCPECGQKIRVPKGKGKIAITCPKCSREFVKRT